MTRQTTPEADVRRPLHETVTAILKQAGHQNPEAWKKFLATDIDMSDPLIEEGLIRRALMQVLVEGTSQDTSIDTIDIRMAVLTSSDRATWLRIFTERVAPCLVKHNMPMTKH